MVNYWGIRLGAGGKYVDEGHSKNFIAIGWEELGDLKWLLECKSDQEAFIKLKDVYRSIYGKDLSNNKVGIDCGEILRFVRMINENDIVVVPNPAARNVIIGRVTGGYSWKENWGDKCHYQYRRSVTWLKIISRTDLSVKLKNSLVWLTVVSLEDHASEIETLVSGIKQDPKSMSVQVTGAELSNRLVERLRDLTSREFEEFTSHLLGIIGFESANRQHVGDGGIDIDGVLNTELGSINLKVQVKQRAGSIGNEKVLQLRGALQTDEHGAIVSTGTFSKPAIEEAEAQGKKLIKLVDKEDLAEIVLAHYNELDTRYKQLLNLKKKDIPLSEQFIMDSAPSSTQKS